MFARKGDILNFLHPIELQFSLAIGKNVLREINVLYKEMRGNGRKGKGGEGGS